MKEYTWTYDAPTGVYVCDKLSTELLEVSQKPGPILPFYAAVILPLGTSFGNLTDDLDVCRVLVYMARYLRQVTPFEPHLRAAIPTEFGRRKVVAWYNTHLDRSLMVDGARFKEIRPEDVL